MRLAWLALALACRRDVPEPEQPIVHVRVVDAGASPPPIAVELEVKANIVETKPDKATGTTLATISAGANHGVRADWLATIVDDTGAVVGRFTITEIKPRTTLGLSALSAKQLEGKLVVLRSPPPAP